MSGEDKDEVRRILQNIQEDINYINRKYPYLEMELETTTIASPFLEDKTKVEYRLVCYIPREEIL